MDSTTQLQTSHDTAPDHKTEKPRVSILKIILWVIAVLILALVIFGIGIYRLSWKGSFVSAVERVVPYPAAVVEGRIISRSDVNERFDAYKRAIEQNQQVDFSDPKNSELLAEQRSALFDRLIDLKLEEILASRMDVDVTNEDISQEYSRVSEQTGYEGEKLDELILNVYGWNRDAFTEFVLVPQIREQKLQAKVNSDFELNHEAYDKISDIKKRLDAGEDFAAVATAESADEGSAAAGGDLGWAPKGLYVKEFEDAAFGLQPGERSDIVVTQFGYHIIELIEKKVDDETKAEQFHLRHILVASRDFYEWLDEQKADAKIWKFGV